MGLLLTKLFSFTDERTSSNTLSIHDFRYSRSDDDLVLNFITVDPKSTRATKFEERSVSTMFFVDRKILKSEESDWSLSTSTPMRLIQHLFPHVDTELPGAIEIVRKIFNQVQNMRSDEHFLNVYFWMMRLREEDVSDDDWAVRSDARIVDSPHVCVDDEREIEYVRCVMEATDAETERIRSLMRVELIEVEEKEDSEEELCCSICFGDLVDGTEVSRMACCSHVFHRRCFVAWLHRSDSCPMCRLRLPY